MFGSTVFRLHRELKPPQHECLKSLYNMLGAMGSTCRAHVKALMQLCRTCKVEAALRDKCGKAAVFEMLSELRTAKALMQRNKLRKESMQSTK